MSRRPQYDEDRTRVDVTIVSVQNAWRQGAKRAAEILRAADAGETPLYTEDEVDFARWDAEGVDMFRPFGEFVGLSDVNDDDVAEGLEEDRETLRVGHEEGADRGLERDDVRDIEALLEESCSVERKQRTVQDANNNTISLDAACRTVCCSETPKTRALTLHAYRSGTETPLCCRRPRSSPHRTPWMCMRFRSIGSRRSSLRKLRSQRLAHKTFPNSHSSPSHKIVNPRPPAATSPA